MTTRAQLRTAIRAELNDAGGTPLWTDALLNQYIVEAIRDYGRELPKEASTTLTVVADQEAYTLPSDFVRAVRVEQPNDVLRWPLTTQRTSNATLGSPSQLIDFEDHVGEAGGKPGYRIWAGQLLLDPIPTAAGTDENIRLDYLARYAEPAADGDTLATPTYDDELLIRVAAAKALEWISTDESKRMRFERSRGVTTTSQSAWYRGLVEAEFARRRSTVRTTTLELTE